MAGHVGGGGLALLLVVDAVVVDGLALVQGLEALLVDGGEVDEHVLTTVGRGDEPEPLLGEELDATLHGHLGFGFLLL